MFDVAVQSSSANQQFPFIRENICSKYWLELLGCSHLVLTTHSQANKFHKRKTIKLFSVDLEFFYFIFISFQLSYPGIPKHHHHHHHHRKSSILLYKINIKMIFFPQLLLISTNFSMNCMAAGTATTTATVTVAVVRSTCWLVCSFVRFVDGLLCTLAGCLFVE